MTDSSFNDDWICTLSRLGRVVMSLHRLAANVAVSEFQERAFDCLKSELAFESASWINGALNPNPFIHSAHSYHLDGDPLPCWIQAIGPTASVPAILTHAGKTLQVTSASEANPSLAVARCNDFTACHGKGNQLVSVFVDSALGLLEGFTLHRSAPGRFTEPERLLVENALPHFVEAWRSCRLRDAARAMVQSTSALGLCTDDGTLIVGSADFTRLMREEWPDWHGPALPKPWLGKRKAAIEQRITAVFHACPAQDKPVRANDAQWIVSLRYKQTAGRLTARETEIAALFGGGASYQQIAAQLDIAPTTVRNHLAKVYRKLKIGNKVELTKLLGHRLVERPDNIEAEAAAEHRTVG